MCAACKDDGELGRVLKILPMRLNSLMRSPDIEVRGYVWVWHETVREHAVIDLSSLGRAQTSLCRHTETEIEA